MLFKSEINFFGNFETTGKLKIQFYGFSLL